MQEMQKEREREREREFGFFFGCMGQKKSEDNSCPVNQKHYLARVYQIHDLCHAFQNRDLRLANHIRSHLQPNS